MDEISAQTFYIRGFSPNLSTSQITYAIEILRQNISSESITTTFSALSTYWQNYNAEDISKEVNKISAYLMDNPEGLQEYDDLVQLLMEHANPNKLKEAKHMAHKIVCGCLGRKHLYDDLGEKDRSVVTNIFINLFPTLASKNTGFRMKWKKFLYRELCIEMAVPVCPTPSCQECSDYHSCYI